MSPPPTKSENARRNDIVLPLIEKFRTKHGDKYDYSKVKIETGTKNYWHVKITVTCPKHGDFYPTPGNHFYKMTGCKVCRSLATKPRSNTSDFIAKARAKHGDIYDYSKVIYEKWNKKVEIICDEHGPFMQSPSKHLHGQGCGTCANIRRNDWKRGTTKQFIEKADTVHEGKYRYNKVDYQDYHTKVEIICEVHGPFFQAPAQHLMGQGCSDCGIEKRTRARAKGQDLFIQEIKDIFGSNYDYEDAIYFNSHQPVSLFCKKPGHGTFARRPVDLLKGAGCQACGYERSSLTQRLSENEFIQRAIKKHDARYSYPNLNYRGLKETISARCPDHGDFEQHAGNHLQGKGCESCAQEIRALFGKTVAQHRRDKTDIPGRLYVLHMFSEEEEFFKIGITSKTVRTRWRSLGEIYDYEVIADLPMGMVRAWTIEQDFLHRFEQKRYEPLVYFAGVTECFSENPLELDIYLQEELRMQLQ